MDLKEYIKAEASALGFSLIGFTTPDPPEHFTLYLDWLKENRHGSMGYLASEDGIGYRAQPQTLLPGAKTIIILAVRYPHPAPGSSGGPKIASYAWPEVDYHLVMPELLQQLAAAIESFLGRKLQYRGFTDGGHILERELAQRAGLGWIGKNSCLISPNEGSYFFLTELFIDAEVPSDPPFSGDRCGSCRRCIDACPTQCILPNRTLDASRCISFLTIENRDAVPQDLRPMLGDWIFGCDICQMVCPWNQKPPLPLTPGFSPGPVFEELDPEKELRLSPQEFKRSYNTSAIKRAKRRGYLRNLAIMMGNSRSAAYVPILAYTLREEFEILVRSHAAWALGMIGTADAQEALLQAQQQEINPIVLKEIETALDMASGSRR